MSRATTPVTVTTPDQEMRFPSATEARVTRAGVLIISRGLATAARFGPGEWHQYTVRAPEPEGASREVT